MSSWKDESREMVMGFNSEPGQVNVTFSKHAAVYVLSASREDFVEQMANIARAFQSRAEVRVVLDGSEVVSVARAE